MRLLTAIVLVLALASPAAADVFDVTWTIDAESAKGFPPQSVHLEGHDAQAELRRTPAADGLVAPSSQRAFGFTAHASGPGTDFGGTVVEGFAAGGANWEFPSPIGGGTTLVQTLTLGPGDNSFTLDLGARNGAFITHLVATGTRAVTAPEPGLGLLTFVGLGVAAVVRRRRAKPPMLR